MFFCAISGAPPTAPVVSKTTGTVYEKALIERYIDENGTDPLSGEALTKEDLVDVKAKPSTLPPRTSTQTSIPALLTSLQSEYDAIMLESLELKKAFQSARQELANSLYREDAATRVMARLMKERDEARDALASIQAATGFASAGPATGGDEGMEVEGQEAVEDEGPLVGRAKEVFSATEAALSSTRRKRKPAADYAKPADLADYVQKSHVPSLHATKPAGITTLDLAKDGNVVVTGGADKVVQLFDLAESKVLGTCKGHTKAVTKVVLREETSSSIESASSRLVISGSADKTVRVWGEDEGGKWSGKHVFKNHTAEITGLGLHPSGAYIAAGSLDSTWSLYDLENLSVVHTYQPTQDEGSFQYSSFGMHPDGYLYGAGTKDGLVRVWDVRNASSLAGNVTVKGKEINSLDFSENGYYLATSSLGAEPEIAIVDLRKLDILASWTLPADSVVSEVKFDPSAQFLGVAGTDYRVYANKSWKELMLFDDNAGVLTGGRWGVNGQEVVLGGMDRSLRVLGVKA